MFSHNEIHSICRNFNIDCLNIGDVIETSRDNDDKRYNYKINNQYFLKINNTETINERFLEDVERLIKRYRSIGVYCPSLYRTRDGKLSHKIVKGDMVYTCYVEELSSITANYSLNKDELEVIDAYKRILFVSFYPNVMLWTNLIANHKWEDKIIELLNIICEF